jgi:hypothetical protein
VLPLYGFLEGDTIGLLILAQPTDTVATLAEKLQGSASVRVARRAQVKLIHRDRVLDPKLTLEQAGIEPLDRFDVVGAG